MEAEDENMSTADALRLFADLMDEGHVLVQLTSKFLREVAAELDGGNHRHELTSD